MMAWTNDTAFSRRGGCGCRGPACTSAGVSLSPAPCCLTGSPPVRSSCSRTRVTAGSDGGQAGQAGSGRVSLGQAGSGGSDGVRRGQTSDGQSGFLRSGRSVSSGYGIANSRRTLQLSTEVAHAVSPAHLLLYTDEALC